MCIGVLLGVLLTNSCWGAGAGTGNFITLQAIQQVQAAVEIPVQRGPGNKQEGVLPRPEGAVVRLDEQVSPPKVVVANEAPLATKGKKADNNENFEQFTILGKSRIDRVRACGFLRKNAKWKVQNCSVSQLVDWYYEEAGAEGVRADLALCQAIVETGTFAFGGIVQPEQNNFCGLGTTGKGVHGASFATPREGVRAHIQHLLAYCQSQRPKQKIVDPRYELVHAIRKSQGLITTWNGLSGKWAANKNYGKLIEKVYWLMLENKL